MKNVIFIITLLAVSFTIVLAAEPCASLDAVEKLNSKEISNNKKLAIIADDYIRSLKNQKTALNTILKAEKTDNKLITKAKAILPTVTGAIKAVEMYKKKYAEIELSDRDFKTLSSKLISESLSAMHDADDVIVIVIGGGDDDDDDDGDKPDCSGAFEQIYGGCAQGVNIKMSCGFYNENGGAAAVEQAMEKCTMDANAAVASCEAGGQTPASMQAYSYETSAYMVCSQFGSGKGDINTPAQTTTPTGN